MSDELYELLKGLTDIPLAMEALILALAGRKKPGGELRTKLLYAVAAAAVLGTLAHALPLSLTWKNLFWMVLYAVLGLCVWLLAVHIDTIAGAESKPGDPYRKLSLLILAVTYIASVAVMLADPEGPDIIVFVAGAALVLLARIPAVVKRGGHLRLFFGLIALGGVLQALRNTVPYAVLWEHLCFLAGLLFL